MSIQNIVSNLELGDGVALYGTQLAVQENYLRFASGVISAAEFKNMSVSRPILIPSPSPNQVILIDKMFLMVQYNTTAYTAGSDVVVVYNDSQIPASTTIASTVFTEPLPSYAYCVQGDAQPSSSGDIVGFGLDLSLAAGTDFATGDSPISWSLWYKIITIA